MVYKYIHLLVFTSPHSFLRRRSLVRMKVCLSRDIALHTISKENMFERAATSNPTSELETIIMLVSVCFECVYFMSFICLSAVRSLPRQHLRCISSTSTSMSLFFYSLFVVVVVVVAIKVFYIL